MRLGLPGVFVLAGILLPTTTAAAGTGTGTGTGEFEQLLPN
jgi:hypothetical protein